MRTKKQRRTPRRRGTGWGAAFTLIELLLVLVILAALAAVVVPKFTRRGEQAKVTACRIELGTIKQAIDAFQIDCTRFPTQAEGLRALVERPGDLGLEWMGYLPGVPTDPWGNPYVYRYPGRHNADTYDLYSFGPDRQEGGGDDLDNWSQF